MKCFLMLMLLMLLLFLVGCLGLFSVVVVPLIISFLYFPCPEEQSETEACWCLVTYQC